MELVTDGIEGWYHAIGLASGAVVKTLAESLGRMGITLHALGGDATEGPGILLFNEVNRHLSEVLYRTSRSGKERVLAIAASGAALPNPGTWQLLQAGAADVLVWDPSQEFALGVAMRLKRWAAVDQLLASPLIRDEIIGQSSVWLSLTRQVIEMARFTEASVLLLGDSGTGKELVAPPDP